ncbi:hypothetical protein D3H59_30355 [Micromonospora endophytica]|nr:hypothetical protein D3H59_30355 [Micromonospora endophytica]
MTAPFLSLAQIRNRLTLAARRSLHDPARQAGRCPVCGTSAAEAEVQQGSTATVPPEPDRHERHQPG